MAILNKMNIPVPPVFGILSLQTFNDIIQGVVNNAFTSVQEQQMVNDALIALFKAKNGDDLTKLEEVQKFKNPQEVVEVFQKVINNLLNCSEIPSDELFQTGTNQIIQVIKKGLPPSTTAE
jgi:hypothetical protein